MWHLWIHLGIGLDPCTQAAAQDVVQAKQFFTRTSKPAALERNWIADTVFMNPPFSELNNWIDKLLEEMQAKRIQIGLVIVPSSRIGELWYHQLISAYPHAVMKEKVNYDRLVDGKRTVAGRSNFVTCLVTVSQKHLCSSVFENLKDIFEDVAWVYRPCSDTLSS